MRFSKRTEWNLEENELTAAVREHVADGRELVDLTVSNPTACEFEYEPERLFEVLSESAAARYEPISLGTVAARNAVVGYYRDSGAEIAVERICLTTSTSEAYSFLFRLLCDPGDEVLIARPSYPLFEFLAQLDDVQLREYPLLYDPNADEQHGWSIDLHSLEAMITDRTRAVIVVHPNNPTGNFASDAEREALERVCAERGLALIVDEVFLDYPIGAKEFRSFAVGDSSCLTFVLSGISKVCGLPQMKASWIAACGPSDLVEDAMSRVEVIADTFLSMNAQVQFALPIWIEQRHGLQAQIRARCRANLQSLDARLMDSSAQRLMVEGGWTAVVRVPRTVAGLPFVEAALERGVLVQPGEFYGLPEGRIVLSLLTPCAIWERGLRLLSVD
jgi:alanine-synthesizing transaminase